MLFSSSLKTKICIQINGYATSLKEFKIHEVTKSLTDLKCKMQIILWKIKTSKKMENLISYSRSSHNNNIFDQFVPLGFTNHKIFNKVVVIVQK